MKTLAVIFLLIRITFILTSPDLPDDTSVYITGSVEQLGVWNPGKVKMESSGNHTWTKEISINGPLSIEYKYTLGTFMLVWEHPEVFSKAIFMSPAFKLDGLL